LTHIDLNKYIFELANNCGSAILMFTTKFMSI
jgi:hypothetical protein